MDFLTIAIASDYKLVDPDRVGAQASKEVQDKTSNGHLDLVAPVFLINIKDVYQCSQQHQTPTGNLSNNPSSIVILVVGKS
eukprot:scaffold221104_cov43-Cyclotella_meneghiniana.AAC.1